MVALLLALDLAIVAAVAELSGSPIQAAIALGVLIRWELGPLLAERGPR